MKSTQKQHLILLLLDFLNISIHLFNLIPRPLPPLPLPIKHPPYKRCIYAIHQHLVKLTILIPELPPCQSPSQVLVDLRSRCFVCLGNPLSLSYPAWYCAALFGYGADVFVLIINSFVHLLDRREW